jgi:hypothetical protein
MKEAVCKQRSRLNAVYVERQGRDDGIELAGGEIRHQAIGDGFPQFDFDVRIRGAQMRDELRHKIGCDRRNDSDPDQSLQRAAALPRRLFQKVDLVKDGPHMAKHLFALLGQQGVLPGPLHKLCAEIGFHLHDLGRECRLADMHHLRSAAEMPRGRKRIEIAHLP